MSLYYEDENVTLYHGDCLTEHREWLEADVLVTDPPYGIGWKRPALKANGKRGLVGIKHEGIQNDATLESRDAALDAWGAKPAAVFAGIGTAPPGGSGPWLVWKKPTNTGVIGAKHGFRRDIEFVHIRNFPLRPAAWSSVLITGGSNTDYFAGHPHSKPVALMESLIEKSPSGVVADPFSGSGSTLVAARNLGRKAIGVELEERYCEIIATRLSQTVLDFGEVP